METSFVFLCFKKASSVSSDQKQAFDHKYQIIIEVKKFLSKKAEQTWMTNGLKLHQRWKSLTWLNLIPADHFWRQKYEMSTVVSEPQDFTWKTTCPPISYCFFLLKHNI